MMPSIQRPLAGDVLLLDLAAEGGVARDPQVLARTGRNARTLLKQGQLRVTLVVLAPGGLIAEHLADGPVMIHVLDGGVRAIVGGQSHELVAGQLLSLAAGVPHAVESSGGATFLLTLVSARG
jgi:quercetin dioxygenase-like cupin family protein